MAEEQCLRGGVTTGVKIRRAELPHSTWCLAHRGLAAECRPPGTAHFGPLAARGHERKPGFQLTRDLGLPGGQ